MHKTAMQAGRLFFATYGKPTGAVLDVGSRDVNGTLRPWAGGMTYVGLDIEQGPGVDIVSPPGDPFPFAPDTFDIVVTTSCFEHDQCFWSSFVEALRVMKPGGVLYMSAPSNGPYHGYPYDNWRFYPDAGRALSAWGRRSGYDVRLIESGTLRRDADVWNDFIAVFQKAPFSSPAGRIVDATRGAMNIRRSKDGEIERFVDATEDQQIIASLRHELAEANRRLDDMALNPLDRIELMGRRLARKAKGGLARLSSSARQ
jgi:SAM-dependent methyltransferase